MTNAARVTAALSEFLNIWACGGNATLQLETWEGGCKVNFSAHLGHPGAPQIPTPPPPASDSPCVPSTSSTPTTSGQRYRGPTPPRFQSSPTTSGQRYRGHTDKQRSRARAASHQAATITAATASVISSSPEAAEETVNGAAVTIVPSQVTSDVNSRYLAASIEDAAASVILDKTVTLDKASTDCQDLGLSLLSAPAELKCWNCDRLMALNHQCGEPLSGPSSDTLPPDCGSSAKDKLKPGSVTAASSMSYNDTPPGSPPRSRRIFPKKFVSDS